MRLARLFLLASCLPCASPAFAEEAGSGWQFSASPYLWLSGLKGDMGVSEEVEPVAVDLSFFGDILSNLKFAAMGTFDARRGRFAASGDVMYISLKASDNPAGDDFRLRRVPVSLGAECFGPADARRPSCLRGRYHLIVPPGKPQRIVER